MPTPTSRNRVQGSASTRNVHTPQPLPPSVSVPENDYEYLEQPEMIVEHRTIPGFLRRIPHRWHMEDINRFGDRVGRAAEAMHLAYLTTTDSKLGVIRIFPVPLMNRVYEIMAAQMNWPPLHTIVDGNSPTRTPRELLRANERVLRHLRTLLEATGDVEVQHSFAVVLDFVGKSCEQLRAAESGETALRVPAAVTAK